MDSNEHIIPEQTPEQESQPKVYTQSPASSEPVSQPSPFANSPYVMPSSQAPYRPYNPAPAATPTTTSSTPKTEKKGIRGGHLVLTAGLMALVAIVACVITASCVNRNTRVQINNITQSFEEQIEVLQDELDSIKRPGANNGESVSGTPNENPVGGMTPAQVFAQNVESVVAINCALSNGTSSGSGFVMTEDGYVITNYHVVEDATKIVVVMHDETQYEANYIGGDKANDIALLKMQASNLRPVKIGLSAELIVGDQVVAIGNPLGELASTLTVGYISAKERIVATDGSQINMLQTDAAINPGNSGGPLFNMNGEVIGITSAKYSGLTSSGATIEGIGFAIPMDDVLGMLEDLKEYGYITGGYLGVSVSDVDKQTAEMYGLPFGALIHSVEPNSCAAKAGMKKQDIITNVGGYKVENLNDLSRALRKFDAGDEITVTVYRNGGDVILNVTLDGKTNSNEENTPTTPDNTVRPPYGGLEDWFDHFFG